MMKEESLTLFIQGDCLSAYPCCDCDYNPHQFSCLQVLSFPFCLAIARNRREVLFELLSGMNKLPRDVQRLWITKYSDTVFDIALMQRDPTVITALLLHFYEKTEFRCHFPAYRLHAALDLISSRGDLTLLIEIEHFLRYRWYHIWLRPLYFTELTCRIWKDLRLRNREILHEVFDFSLSACYQKTLWRMCLDSDFLLRCAQLCFSDRSKFRFKPLSAADLLHWPKGAATLIEEGLLVSKHGEVRSLRHSCRIAIRGFLRKPVPIRDSVKKLPLPKCVRKTLAFYSLPVYDFDGDLTPFKINKASERFPSEIDLFQINNLHSL